jgi:hypothetical protein
VLVVVIAPDFSNAWPQRQSPFGRRFLPEAQTPLHSKAQKTANENDDEDDFAGNNRGIAAKGVSKPSRFAQLEEAKRDAAMKPTLSRPLIGFSVCWGWFLRLQV